MPLIRSASDAARRENTRREIEAGKDPAQAVAIGYAVQRRARRPGTLSQVKKRRRAESQG